MLSFRKPPQRGVPCHLPPPLISRPPCVLSPLPGQLLRSWAGKKNGIFHYVKKMVFLKHYMILAIYLYICCSRDLAELSYIWDFISSRASFCWRQCLSHLTPTSKVLLSCAPVSLLWLWLLSRSFDTLLFYGCPHETLYHRNMNLYNNQCFFLCGEGVLRGILGIVMKSQIL